MIVKCTFSQKFDLIFRQISWANTYEHNHKKSGKKKKKWNQCNKHKKKVYYVNIKSKWKFSNFYFIHTQHEVDPHREHSNQYHKQHRLRMEFKPCMGQEMLRRRRRKFKRKTISTAQGSWMCLDACFSIYRTSRITIIVGIMCSALSNQREVKEQMIVSHVIVLYMIWVSACMYCTYVRTHVCMFWIYVCLSMFGWVFAWVSVIFSITCWFTMFSGRFCNGKTNE